MKFTNTELAHILTVMCKNTYACPVKAAHTSKNWGWGGTDVEKCPFGKKLECCDVSVRAWNKVFKKSE